jgi:hypothetical protein
MASVRARNTYIFARSILLQWLARNTLICQRATTTGGVGFPHIRSMLPADTLRDLWSFFGICWGAWSLTTFLVARARTTRQLYARPRDPPYLHNSPRSQKAHMCAGRPDSRDTCIRLLTFASIYCDVPIRVRELRSRQPRRQSWINIVKRVSLETAVARDMAHTRDLKARAMLRRLKPNPRRTTARWMIASI